MKVMRPVLAATATLLMASSVFSQSAPNTSESGLTFQARHPDATESATTPDAQKQPAYRYFSVLDGVPEIFELHHDTEAHTGKRIDVYLLVIEKQTMNSDGKREPIGLQFGNYYTAEAMDPATAWNPANAADCKTWVGLTLTGLEHHESGQPWPYIQFATAKGARTIETNEDGAVFWSDDIECWGALDRFAPF